MGNISIINNDNSFAIYFFNFKYNDSSDYNYFQYKFCLKSGMFKVFTDTYSSADELCKFRKDLIAFLEKDSKAIYFAPLGEFWMMKFSWKETGMITLEGGISDVEELQSRLEFYAFLSVDDLLKTVKELGDFLDNCH